MTVEMTLFFVLEEHPLPTCFETTGEMFHDLKNVCPYNTAYVLLNQFARSSGSCRFYCHVMSLPLRCAYEGPHAVESS
jgi:hypothetical protein